MKSIRLPHPHISWVRWICLGFIFWFCQSARADSLPMSASIPGVVGHPQSYSLSCEARSAADWMSFWGVNISEADFLSRLPRADNPDMGFVGSPSDLWGNIPPRGYGVHAAPVAVLLREYGFEAEAKRDLTWDDLRSEIAAGRPAIVWIIGQMWSGTPRSFTDSEGHNTIVASFEHTMILTGYDDSYVYVVDAFSGINQTYSIKTFLDSWAVLGAMAITGQKPDSEAHVVSQPENQNGDRTYTVQRGEYLMELAERFGTTWQELAARNHVTYPYTIFPGQVLNIPGEETPIESPTTVEPSPEASPTLLPTPLPTPVPVSLRPEEVHFRYYLPQVCQKCQPVIRLMLKPPLFWGNRRR
jgi:uncharacterized protein YvpB